MENIKSFIRRREVTDYQDHVFLWVFIALSMILVAVIWRKPFSIVLAVITVIITIEYLFLRHRGWKRDLYLVNVLYGVTLIIIDLVFMRFFLGEFVHSKLSFAIFLLISWHFLLCFFTMFRINYLVRNNCYGETREYGAVNSSSIVAVGGIGGLGYVLGGYLEDFLGSDVVGYLLFLGLVAINTCVVIRCSESIMVHYYVRRYNLGDQIRIRHEIGR